MFGAVQFLNVVIVTLLTPQQLLLTVRQYFRCGFICFMFGAVQFLNVLTFIKMKNYLILFSKQNSLYMSVVNVPISAFSELV